MGTEKSKGFAIYSLSGHVKRPGQYEAPLGITLRELLDLAGGIREGHELKFWTPGGSSTPILTAEHLDVPLDFEGVGAAGSMLGTKALQMFDETTSVVRCVLRWTEFYKHESCGKCTPCREGTWWLVQILQRLEPGRARRATSRCCSTCATTSSAARSAPSATARRARSPARSSTSATSAAGMTHRVGAVPARAQRAGRDTGPDERHPGQEGAHDRGHRQPGHAPTPVDLVTLTIDGVEVSVPEGTLVIRAAELVGVQIPRFCDHPLLEPVGACRQCLVDMPDAGNGRADAQAAGVLHDRRSPRAWWSRPRSPRRSPTRRSRGSWSSC